MLPLFLRIGFCASWLSVVLLTAVSADDTLPQELPFETIINNFRGGSIELPIGPNIFVSTDKHEWKKVWKLAHYQDPFRPPLPEIDFDTHITIAVFGAGLNPSIVRVTKGDNGITILVHDIRPGFGCPPGTGDFRVPVHIVKVERVERKIRRKGTTLTIERETVDCQPPPSQ